MVDDANHRIAGAEGIRPCERRVMTWRSTRSSDLQKSKPSEPVPVLGNPNGEPARVEGYAVAKHQNGIRKIEESAAVQKLDDRRLPGHSKWCSAVQMERARETLPTEREATR